MGDGENAFQPRMPAVDPIPNAPAFFARMREQVAHPPAEQRLEPGQRCIGVVTPGRMLMFVPAPRPGSVAAEQLAAAKRLLSADRPLNITAIAYTELQPLMQDQAKCIPLLSQFLALAYLEHNVVIFEGHPSVFEAGVASVDALVVDSGMLPFLPSDWVAVALRVMASGGRVFLQDRKTTQLRPVVRAANQQGWRFGEPDGEMSYLNCLLTTLAKRTPTRVEVVEGSRVPDLAALTSDPGELEWIAELPFRYERLSAKVAIALALKLGKWTRNEDGASSTLLQTKLAVGGQLQPVAFRLRLAKDPAGVYRLQIEKQA